MTDDPIRTAAEHLAGRIGTDAIGLIEAAFRQQRAEAERECEEMRKGWRYTEHRAEVAEAEVSRLRAALEQITNVSRVLDPISGASDAVRIARAALQVGEAIPQERG